MSVSDPQLPAPPRSATKTAVIATLALVFTFVAGFLVGVVTDRIMHFRRGGPPPLVAQTLLNRLDRQLDLTDEQRAGIREIILRRHARMNDEIALANADIEKLLTPEQREKFRKLRMRHHGPAMRPRGTAQTESTR